MTFNKLKTSQKMVSIEYRNRDSLSKKYYQHVVAYDLLLKQNYETIMQLPRLDKIVLNTTSKLYSSDKKYILFTLAALELISGQKPQLTFARKSIANFKIREAQILGCQAILHQNQMYNFLDKLCKIILPRIRETAEKKSLVQSQQFQKSNQLVAWSFGLKTLLLFPELETHYDLVETFRGMDVTFVCSNATQKTSRLLLSALQLPVLI